MGPKSSFVQSDEWCGWFGCCRLFRFGGVVVRNESPFQDIATPLLASGRNMIEVKACILLTVACLRELHNENEQLRILHTCTFVLIFFLGCGFFWVSFWSLCLIMFCLRLFLFCFRSFLFWFFISVFFIWSCLLFVFLVVFVFCLVVFVLNFVCCLLFLFVPVDTCFPCLWCGGRGSHVAPHTERKQRQGPILYASSIPH